MHRSTTFVGTESSAGKFLRRRTVLALLSAEAVGAIFLLGRRPTPVSAAAPAAQQPEPGQRSFTTHDGRTVQLLALGADSTLPGRIAAELDSAVDAVTEFWGADWRTDISIVVTGTDEEFRVLAGGSPDFAASTTVDHIVFAPEAAAMGPGALRIVLRHELFHYASRPVTAADAPWWLTEGVADYVGRPHIAPPVGSAEFAVLPTDADFRTTGPALSQAYDRAWWFTRYVAARFGEPTLRRVYLTACGTGHPDADTALMQTLGMDRNTMLADWRRWLAG